MLATPACAPIGKSRALALRILGEGSEVETDMLGKCSPIKENTANSVWKPRDAAAHSHSSGIHPKGLYFRLPLWVRPSTGHLDLSGTQFLDHLVEEL